MRIIILLVADILLLFTIPVMSNTVPLFSIQSDAIWKISISEVSGLFAVRIVLKDSYNDKFLKFALSNKDKPILIEIHGKEITLPAKDCISGNGEITLGELKSIDDAMHFLEECFNPR